MDDHVELEKVSDYIWRIPRTGGMRVDGFVYATEKLMHDIQKDESLKQVANVAHLPGIVRASYAMPDIHWGYGFAIGGVAAFDVDEGIVSPGGVGFDISCGVRLLRSDLTYDDIKNDIPNLVEELFREVPSGVGSHRRNFKLSLDDEKQLLKKGARWALEQGYGDASDLEHIEDNGCLSGADYSALTQRALERGRDQSGTLGAGNHFLEIGYVDRIFNPSLAEVLGLFPNQITIFIHSGSRGLGYQVCDDNIHDMIRAAARYGIHLPDRQLCCAPINSPEGRKYLSAMAAAANYAMANRQMISHYVRETFEKYFGKSWRELGLYLIYDVSHNIAKFEEYMIEGELKRVLVHRKGATRAFPPNHPKIPEAYKNVGQPVLIPGDMGRYSYVLVGTERAYQETFGSTCHGAGRLMSRHAAKNKARGRNVILELKDKGICVHGASKETIVEEIPDAYKDVADVVDAVEGAGLSRKVARLRPVGVVKG